MQRDVESENTDSFNYHCGYLFIYVLAHWSTDPSQRPSQHQALTGAVGGQLLVWV